MFEVLSDVNWLKPQIDFLLILQNLRLLYGDILNPLFINITILGEYFLPTLICSIVYWGFDSKNGAYMFLVSGFNVIFAHLLKLLACVYRPWILSERIKPFEGALNHALSYSFPSGHSAMSSSVLGAWAFVLRRKIWPPVLLILLILLVGFSRMWLGVHTPQDVIGGFTIGIILVFGLNYIINWAEQDKKRYTEIQIYTNIFAVLALVYLTVFNHYPADYVNGELLVDPKSAIRTTYTCYAFVLGLLNGLCICRRFFSFDATFGGAKQRIVRCLFGALLMLFFLHIVFEYVWKSSFSIFAVFLIMFVLGAFPTLIYPLVFRKVEKM